jgi:hypothetical protein
VSVLENQNKIAMNKALCTALVATQLMGAWLASAQDNNDCPTKQQQSAIQANTCTVAAVSAISAMPLIAVSPSKLDFGRVQWAQLIISLSRCRTQALERSQVLPLQRLRLVLAMHSTHWEASTRWEARSAKW